MAAGPPPSSPPSPLRPARGVSGRVDGHPLKASPAVDRGLPRAATGLAPPSALKPPHRRPGPPAASPNLDQAVVVHLPRCRCPRRPAARPRSTSEPPPHRVSAGRPHAIPAQPRDLEPPSAHSEAVGTLSGGLDRPPPLARESGSGRHRRAAPVGLAGADRTHGAEGRIRTVDPVIFSHVLYQAELPRHVGLSVSRPTLAPCREHAARPGQNGHSW